jgi:uncharacterized protein (TIGR02246 family)
MNTTLDSELVNATTHSCQVYDDAYNNNDPQALAELFTEDATLVTDTGILHGREAILKYQIEAFKIITFSNHKGRPDFDSIRPIGTDGKEFFAAGTWSQTMQMQDGKPFDMKGFWSAIILNDGTGRDVMQTWNVTPGDQTK